MRELCFRIKLIDESIKINETNEMFIDDFIEFAIKNKVSLGGNLYEGFCFCVDSNKSLPVKLKSVFISFLILNHSKEINNIEFKTFDEQTDEFITSEIIHI